MLRSIPTSVFALLVLLAAAAFVFSAETQSPSLFAADTVREVLKEQGVAPEMKIIPRTSSDLRQVASRNLDPRLLTQAQSISGRDFQYVFPASIRTAHLGVIVLRYPSVDVVKQMIALLLPRQNYFRNSKILVRFSAVSVGNLLVVTYSENSGDDRIVKALNNLPASFQEASGTGAVSWGEPEPLKVSQ